MARNSRLIAKDFYVYPSEVLNIGFLANANDAINIQADSDFILHKLTMYALDLTTPGVQTDSTRVLPDVSVQITDQGSGRQIFQSAIPIPTIFGHGSLPFILPSPRRFASNSVISINYTNLSAVTAYRIFLQFVGIKIYVGR